VFEAIARQKPEKLLVIADGPRSVDEAIDCAEARSIIDLVDWDCDVSTNFSETNMGCRERVSSGISWVFEQCEEAIILEDDCLPHPTFFRFCDELVERYRYDERVMVISGDNFQAGHKRGMHSYYFSAYNHVWGWASWRRAWKLYDPGMKGWPERRGTSWLMETCQTPAAARFWRDKFDQVYSGRIDTWDYQWTFACWLHHGLSVLPNVNLVSNIGFGGKATHTGDPTSVLANIPPEEMKFPLQHPTTVTRDEEADAYTSDKFYRPRAPFLSRAVRRGIRILHPAPSSADSPP